MDNLIETIETFLSYSDEKLEELAQLNQELREGPLLNKDDQA